MAEENTSRISAIAGFLHMCRSATAGEVLGWSNRALALVCALFTFALFTVCNFAYVGHGVNDDWALSNALSGNWGDPQGITLFLNAGLCQVISWLNANVGGPNWFFALEFTTAYLSFFALAYLSASRMSVPFACLTIAAFMALALPGCTWESNFTFVAFSACCAGLACLLLSLGQPRHSAPLVVSGLAFVFVGVLWRANIFLVAIPVFGVAALMVLAMRPASDEAAGAVGTGGLRAAARLWPFAAALLVLVACLAYHGSVWSDPALDEWFQFNEARSSFADYPKKDYAEVAEDLAALGVSETDYEMLTSWITEDPDFFTAERVADINSVALQSNETTAGKVAYTFARYGYRVLTNAALVPFVLLAVACCFLVASRRRGVCAFALMVLALLIGTALLVVGRLPERVNHPLWIYTFCAMGCLVAAWGGQAAQERSAEAHAGNRKGSREARAAMCLVVAACLAFPVTCAVSATQRCASLWNPERVQAVVAPETFAPQSALLSYVNGHPETTVLINAGAYYDIVYTNLMILPCDEQTTARVISLGGWSTRSPYSNGRNLRAGAKNPLKALVENNSAVYVAYSDKTAKLIQRYLREHYYPHATFAQVDVVPTHDGREELCVFKFSGAEEAPE